MRPAPTAEVCIVPQNSAFRQFSAVERPGFNRLLPAVGAIYRWNLVNVG
jgi:hypothetical protein